MKECPSCERLKQRIAELNSELLVLKIAAIAGAKDTRSSPPARKTRNTSRSIEEDQPQVS
jgi:hypothetical protein